MKKIFLFILLSLAVSQTSNAQTIDDFFNQTDQFLKKNVNKEGKIDYASLQKSPGELFYILENASKLNPQFADLDTAKAYWINIYNLCVIKSIVQHYPITSVNNVSTFFNADFFRISNQDVTLDDIEHTILREILFEPAFHFVLNSGANGSPTLLNKAYLPKTVNEQIKEQTIKVINSKDYFLIDKKSNTIRLPKIFDWYKKDFEVNYFNTIDFINLFSEKKIDNTLKVVYYEFDWTLNDIQ